MAKAGPIRSVRPNALSDSSFERVGQSVARYFVPSAGRDPSGTVAPALVVRVRKMAGS